MAETRIFHRLFRTIHSIKSLTNVFLIFFMHEKYFIALNNNIARIKAIHLLQVRTFLAILFIQKFDCLRFLLSQDFIHMTLILNSLSKNSTKRVT